MYYEIFLKEAIKVMNGKAERIRNELIRGVSIDSRTIKPGELFFALKGENTDGHRFTFDAVEKGAFGVVVRERTGAEGEILVNDTLFALGELARYYRNKIEPVVIGITGTNGTTPVKNLIASILSLKFKVLWTKKSYNSLIGLPLMVFEISGDEDYVILEMGTNNPGEIKRLCEITRPVIGVITNIGPGHLKGLSSIEGVRKEKMSLIDALPERGFGFVGPGIGEIPRKNVFPIPFDDSGDYKITEFGSSFNFRGKEYFTPLLGVNNIYNCIAALTVTEKLGVDYETQKIGLENIKPESGRMEPIWVDGLLIINDAYNANPLSMKAAIDFISTIKRKKIFVLGDMLELGEESEKYHKEIGAYARAHCDYLLTFGKFAQLYQGHHFDDKMALVKELKKIIRGDEVILLKASRVLRFEDILNKLLRSV
jgi:UDP-N-acetylmuramoyl-tripeptide--D-alanyl-D-alanine ligase